MNRSFFNSTSNTPVSLHSSLLPGSMQLEGFLNLSLWIKIGIVLLFIAVAVYIYLYHISPSSKKSFHPNNEQVPAGSVSTDDAELLFFYADWCPHCKAAKPIWNDLKSEYENKTINGYKVIFTDIDCTEETAEVEKLMNQYKIEGYPTIKLIKDGQVIEYDAKPNKETLVKFLNTVL